MPKILIAYYSKTGNTEKIANAISAGTESISNVLLQTVAENKRLSVEVKRVENIDAKEAVEADGFAFGSPSYFSVMSGPMLTLLTELYFVRDKLAGKPMVAFATGIGGQTKALENIESILKAFNPDLIQPGLATGSTISDADEQQARKMGEKLAKAVTETK